jgi:hypothetical protein
MAGAWHFVQYFFSLLALLWFVIALLGGLLVAAGCIQGLLDRRRISQALYLAFITALTIGYGDIVPRTKLSKLLSVLIGIIGVVLTGLIVAAAVYAAEATIQQVHGQSTK